MDKQPSPETNNQTPATPDAEVLKPRTDSSAPSENTTPISSVTAKDGSKGKQAKRRTYRPSHKATFIGLFVVIMILAINAGVLTFILKGKSKANNQANSGQVTLSPSVLNKIGVNTSSVGNSGTLLEVGPDAQFDGKMTVAGNVNIGGALKLNSTFTASDANLNQLEAGNTALSQLDVNGNTTLSALSLRDTLAVTGATQLQGAVTIGQLLTVNNNLNLSGNLSIGGVLITKSFSAGNLTSTSTLNVAGHIITGGSEPSVGPGTGGALGSNGTVSISGDDSAGAIAVNIGVGATSGVLANVAFHTEFNSLPRVVISPVNSDCGFGIYNLTTSGFTVEDNCSLAPGGYYIDFIAEQ